MKTITLSAKPTTVTINKKTRAKFYKIYLVAKKQLKRLGWLLERHPGFAEENAWDEHLGLEVRRMKF